MTVFTNNCLAGFIYERYGLKYLSPTIGIKFELFSYQFSLSSTSLINQKSLKIRRDFKNKME
ncbi:MAG: DUF1919 domain-containing protein [Cyanobacteria bacterium SIG27]|nr:DUF1919 domain-containing protein [Cyanobacteria bacterium SIG27]